MSKNTRRFTPKSTLLTLLHSLLQNVQVNAFDEPGKGEARGEEPAVAPAGEAQRLRCAKAAPGRKVVSAATIVRDCNAHDRLVTLAEHVQAYFEGTDSPILQEAVSALKLAKGE